MPNGHATTEDREVRLCSFHVGEERYVVDIQRIREIGRPLPVTPVRRGSPLIEGVIDLRGQIIPVIDLRKVMGLPPKPETRATKHMIANVGGKAVGFVVDVMGRVLRVPRSSIQSSPTLMDQEGARVFPGVVNHQGELYLLLNLRGLLEIDNRGERIQAMRDAVLEESR